MYSAETILIDGSLSTLALAIGSYVAGWLTAMWVYGLHFPTRRRRG